MKTSTAGAISRSWVAGGRFSPVLGFLLSALAAHADAGVVTVSAQPVTARLEAYAQVEPIARLPVRAATAGIVRGLGVVPGTAVEAGQTLAELAGPEVDALRVRRETAVTSLQARLASAQENLAALRRQLPAHLSTQQAVAEAESTAAAAQADLEAARAQLRAAREQAVLRAPAAGTVLAVEAADGERVAPGQALLVLQPADRLWLRATFYGADAAAVRVDMSGQFLAAGRAEAIPVRVTSISAAVQPDGGEAVGLVATAPAPGWRNGDAGTVTLAGPTRPLVAVPTRALVLDRGRWWVLVHTPQGDRPQEVVPGPARGWQTYLERGLEPGAEIVVEDAYLEYHRGIARSYQPPD